MEKILGWLFRGYVRRLDEDYRQKERVLKASLDIKDIVRERLKGVRPGHPDDVNWLNNKIASMELPERLDFLSKAHAVSHNDTFKVVTEYLMVEAQRKATLDAVDIIDVNFQRATINGLQLLEDELERLASMYLEEKKAHELMTIQESHEVI